MYDYLPRQGLKKVFKDDNPLTAFVPGVNPVFKFSELY